MFFVKESDYDFIGIQILGGGDPGNGCRTAFVIVGMGTLSFYVRSPSTLECYLDGFEALELLSCEMEVIPTLVRLIPTLSQWGTIAPFLLIMVVFSVNRRNKRNLTFK